MSDVTLTFTANDQGVVQSLARQEAAINASIGRMQNRYAGVTNKFAGPAAIGGFLAGAGIGSTFAVVTKLIDGYSASSDQAAESTRALTEEWERFWGLVGGATVGAVVDSINQFQSGVRELPDMLRPLAGITGLLNTDFMSEFRESGKVARDLDKWAESTKKNMEASTKAAASFAAVTAGLERARAASSNPGNDFARRRAVAFTDYKIEERRIDDLAASGTRAHEINALRETNRLKLEESVRAANAAEDVSRADARERKDAEANEYSRRRKTAKEDAQSDLSSMRAATLRAQGRDSEADAVERELQLRTRLLDISQMLYVNEGDRLDLMEAAAALFEAQSDAAIKAARIVFGGRGVEAGLASAPGVVRGSLVATARDNPAALQRRSNELLERIARAVEEGGSAVFAP